MIGRKDDAGKLRWDLVPMGTMGRVVAVLTHGASHYNDNNWQDVENPRSRYYAALMRHVEAWWRGEQNDTDTGLPHLAHAVCCALFLMWFDGEAEQ